MTEFRQGPMPGRGDSQATLPHPCGLTAQAMAWWRARQIRRRELKLLCSRQFPGYRRTVNYRGIGI